MLKSVHIKSYRSCKDVKLEGMENLLVLMGRNGAGKTNILKAILAVAKTLSNNVDPKDEDKLTSSSGGEVYVTFQISDKLYEYYINYSSRLEISDGEGHQKTEYLEKLSKIDNQGNTTLMTRNGETILIPALENNRYEVSKNISAINAMQSLLPEENNFRQLLEAVSKFFSSITYYPLEINEPKYRAPFLTQAQYQSWIHNKKTITEPATTVLAKILHLYLTNKEKYEELLSLLGDDGLGIISHIEVHELKIPSQPSEDISQDKFTKIYFVGFRPSGHKKTAVFQIGDLSFGTKRVLNFVVSLLFDSASVALIEQIEDGIHEGLVDKLIPLIRDYAEGAQFILASHSTAVFNRIKPDEVRIVELDKGVTTARALSKIEIDSAVEYMRLDGPFSDFLQSI